MAPKRTSSATSNSGATGAESDIVNVPKDDEQAEIKPEPEPETQEEERKRKAEEETARKESKRKRTALDDAVERWKLIKEKVPEEAEREKFLSRFGDEFIEKPGAKKEAREKLLQTMLKDQKVDTTISDRSKFEVGIPKRPDGYGAKYLAEGWQVKGIAGVDNPATLLAEAWMTLADINKMFFGYNFGPDAQPVKARAAAFEFKEPLKDRAPSSKGALEPQKTPFFEVYDNASIDVIETSTSTENAVATHGFSSDSVTASVSAGGWGAAVAASGGYKREIENSFGETVLKENKQYVARYKFPRVKIILDDLNLSVTDHCAEHLKQFHEAAMAVRANRAKKLPPDDNGCLTKALMIRDNFRRLYGHIFATNFQLGGLLHGTRNADSDSKATQRSDRDDVKMAAALSVQASYGSFSGGASASYEREKKEKKDTLDTRVNNKSAFAWDAIGGNTLLCANPAEWANSVAGFQTWRKLEQSAIELIPSLAAKINPAAWKNKDVNIADDFSYIDHREWQKAHDVARGQWNGKFTLETLDGNRLVVNENGYIVLSKERYPENELVFTVLEANVNNRSSSPRAEKLCRENPYFLVTGDDYKRDPKRGFQIPGLWVDSAGALRSEVNAPQATIGRWTLGRNNNAAGGDFTNPFKSDKKWIENGEEVKLICHSFSYGHFTSNDDPPYAAPETRRWYYSQQKTDFLYVGKLDIRDVAWSSATEHTAFRSELQKHSPETLIRCINDEDEGRSTKAQNEILEDYRQFFMPQQSVFDRHGSTGVHYSFDARYRQAQIKEKIIKGAQGMSEVPFRLRYA